MFEPPYVRSDLRLKIQHRWEIGSDVDVEDRFLWMRMTQVSGNGSHEQAAQRFLWVAHRAESCKGSG